MGQHVVEDLVQTQIECESGGDFAQGSLPLIRLSLRINQTTMLQGHGHRGGQLAGQGLLILAERPHLAQRNPQRANRLALIAKGHDQRGMAANPGDLDCHRGGVWDRRKVSNIGCTVLFKSRQYFQEHHGDFSPGREMDRIGRADNFQATLVEIQERDRYEDGWDQVADIMNCDVGDRFQRLGRQNRRIDSMQMLQALGEFALPFLGVGTLDDLRRQLPVGGSQVIAREMQVFLRLFQNRSGCMVDILLLSQQEGFQGGGETGGDAADQGDQLAGHALAGQLVRQDGKRILKNLGLMQIQLDQFAADAPAVRSQCNRIRLRPHRAQHGRSQPQKALLNIREGDERVIDSSFLPGDGQRFRLRVAFNVLDENHFAHFNLFSRMQPARHFCFHFRRPAGSDTSTPTCQGLRATPARPRCVPAHRMADHPALRLAEQGCEPIPLYTIAA